MMYNTTCMCTHVILGGENMPTHKNCLQQDLAPAQCPGMLADLHLIRANKSLVSGLPGTHSV